MIKIYICDDDEHYLLKVKQLLEGFCAENQLETEILTFSSPKALKTHLSGENEKPDLLFLDIEFGDCSGLDVAKEINATWPSIQIAFLTNYISYATDAYETNHFYYVLKEELEGRLPNIVKRFHEGRQKILIKTARKEWQFDMDQILYVERGRRSCNIILAGGGQEKISVSFETVLYQLPYPCFMRCHHSFLINLSHLRSLQTEEIELDDGTRVPVSRTYRAACREQFIKWQEIWI